MNKRPLSKCDIDDRFDESALSRAAFLSVHRKVGAGVALIEIARQTGEMLSHVGFAAQADSYEEYRDCVGLQKRGDEVLSNAW